MGEIGANQLSGFFKGLSSLQKHLQWTEIGILACFNFLVPAILPYKPEAGNITSTQYSDLSHSSSGTLSLMVLSREGYQFNGSDNISLADPTNTEVIITVKKHLTGYNFPMTPTAIQIQLLPVS